MQTLVSLLPVQGAVATPASGTPAEVNAPAEEFAELVDELDLPKPVGSTSLTDFVPVVSLSPMVVPMLPVPALLPGLLPTVQTAVADLTGILPKTAAPTPDDASPETPTAPVVAASAALPAAMPDLTPLATPEIHSHVPMPNSAELPAELPSSLSPPSKASPAVVAPESQPGEETTARPVLPPPDAGPPLPAEPGRLATTPTDAPQIKASRLPSPMDTVPSEATPAKATIEPHHSPQDPAEQPAVQLPSLPNPQVMRADVALFQKDADVGMLERSVLPTGAQPSSAAETALRGQMDLMEPTLPAPTDRAVANGLPEPDPLDLAKSSATVAAGTPDTPDTAGDAATFRPTEPAPALAPRLVVPAAALVVQDTVSDHEADRPQASVAPVNAPPMDDHAKIDVRLPLDTAPAPSRADPALKLAMPLPENRLADLSLLPAAIASEDDLDLDLIPISAPLSTVAGPAAQGHTMPGATVAHLVNRIVDTVERNIGGTTEIALSPDELGHVKMTVQTDAQNPDRIILHLSFDRPETLELFRRHLDQLTEAIRAAGYSQADIGFGTSGSGTGSGQASSSNAPPLRNPGDADDYAAATPALPSARPAFGGSGLDLRL